MSWPRIFHRIWLDESESPHFAAWKARLAELHPSWEIRTWQDSSELRWLRNQELFDRYLATDPFGRVPDILRYELLWRFGGVYIDCDFEPLRPLDDLLEDERPFAAWENDRTLCTALLASPPGHDAIDELIRDLPAHMARHERATPNVASGPEFATARWKVRDDVRRLPPWTFYPVGWWEKELLGDPANYHPDSYAVHHWAKGWGAEQMARKTVEELRVVVLVGYRAGDEARARAWEAVRPHLESFGWPVYVADAGGEWNRAAALNRAASDAGGWDVALITDADTLLDTAATTAAVVQAHRDGSAVVCWNVRWKLSERGTARIVAEGTAGWRRRGTDIDTSDRTPPRLQVRHRGGPIVVSRAAWDAAGPFDEGFVGWGHEDVALRIGLEALAPGGLAETAGTIWHLWHPRAGAPSEANEERKRAYEAAAGDPEALRGLLRPVAV